MMHEDVLCPISLDQLFGVVYVVDEISGLIHRIHAIETVGTGPSIGCACIQTIH